jgi:O-antigen ligase
MSAQLAQGAVFLLSGGLFLVAAYQLQDLRWLKILTYFFVAIGSLHLAVRLVPVSVVDLGTLLPQTVTMGSMFWTWIVALSFGQFFLNRDMPPLGRLAMAAVSLSAIGIGLTQLRTWVSGWMPALLSVGVIVFLRYPLPILLATPVLAALGLVGASYFSDLATAGDNLYSYETRVVAARSLLPILSANPVLGLGPANYYHYTLLYPILGWYVKFNSHNNYLDLIAQTGLVGLICFLWFALAVGMTAWRLRLTPMRGFERGYVCSVLAGLIATLVAAAVGDWVIPFVYNTGFQGFRTSVLPWIFMGGLVAIEQKLLRRA